MIYFKNLKFDSANKLNFKNHLDKIIIDKF